MQLEWRGHSVCSCRRISHRPHPAQKQCKPAAGQRGHPEIFDRYQPLSSTSLNPLGRSGLLQLSSPGLRLRRNQYCPDRSGCTRCTRAKRLVEHVRCQAFWLDRRLARTKPGRAQSFVAFGRRKTRHQPTHYDASGCPASPNGQFLSLQASAHRRHHFAEFSFLGSASPTLRRSDRTRRTHI